MFVAEGDLLDSSSSAIELCPLQPGYGFHLGSQAARQKTRQAESRRRIFPGSASIQRVAIDFAGPANEIIGVGARGEYCGSGHDKKGNAHRKKTKTVPLMTWSLSYS